MSHWKPGQEVTKIRGDGDAHAQVTRITCLPETGHGDTTVATMPATAAAAQGDYFHISRAHENSLATAFWLDIDEDGTEPTGEQYVAAEYKIRVPIATGGTAAQNAAALLAVAVNLDGFNAEAGGTGEVDFVRTGHLNYDGSDSHTADNGETGSVVMNDAGGATSNLNGRYFRADSAPDVAFGVFLYTGAGYSDPETGWGMAWINLIGGETASQVAALIAAGINNVGGNGSAHADGPVVTLSAQEPGPLTYPVADVEGAETGFTFSTVSVGQLALVNASGSQSDLLIDPALIT